VGKKICLNDEKKKKKMETDENVIELNILAANLEGDVPDNLDTFLSLDFFDHETLITPVRSGTKINYNLQARFVRISLFFLLSCPAIDLVAFCVLADLL
jgi:hypothetical protein